MGRRAYLGTPYHPYNRRFARAKGLFGYSHDDDAVIYINGIKVVDTGYAWKKHVVTKLPEEVVATLKPGENLIAASCRNRAHGGLLDFGLAVEKEGQRSFVQIARQLSVEIQPMQTLYKFACGPVNLDLTFTVRFLWMIWS